MFVECRPQTAFVWSWILVGPGLRLHGGYIWWLSAIVIVGRCDFCSEQPVGMRLICRTADVLGKFSLLEDQTKANAPGTCANGSQPEIPNLQFSASPDVEVGRGLACRLLPKRSPFSHCIIILQMP